ncbi:hypothetical protein EVAR_14603_1 [Eumeta japonica]|uniref:Uncharacterized protein n=1 Tax=Eumeta variegata TaxID=151549 RepID=A0A4C1UWA8_EUMVA|nr:hypothetical protein EVAR_14603_1 [Eumeta japonica]
MVVPTSSVKVVMLLLPSPADIIFLVQGLINFFHRFGGADHEIRPHSIVSHQLQNELTLAMYHLASKNLFSFILKHVSPVRVERCSQRLRLISKWSSACGSSSLNGLFGECGDGVGAMVEWR